MNYWWVNHKQTFQSEIGGGYIWSPTKNKNNGFNQTYENLTLASSGDMIFSYADTKIRAIGIIKQTFEHAPVPPEFGEKGNQWDKNGYLVKVEWDLLTHPFKPKDFIDVIADLLPQKYSPLQKNGNGNQGVYLAKIDTALGEKLIKLIRNDNLFIAPELENIKADLKEDKEQEKIEKSDIPETEKMQLIKARRGQGIFRTNLSKIEFCCRVSGLRHLPLLNASHIKPWRDSNNRERLDGNNGLLLSPHIDKLFDRGWISFTDAGEIIVAKNARGILKTWNIPLNNVGKFNTQQAKYLKHHREHVFKDRDNLK